LVSESLIALRSEKKQWNNSSPRAVCFFIAEHHSAPVMWLRSIQNAVWMRDI